MRKEAPGWADAKIGPEDNCSLAWQIVNKGTGEGGGLGAIETIR